MCGRFSLTLDPDSIQETFPEYIFPTGLTPRYNIAPTQPILAIPNDGRHQAGHYLWGLIPSWAKDPAIGSRMINARAETLAEKPSFRAAYKHHRCLIPSTGFYEWQALPGSKGKVPHFIHLRDGSPFTFAGLWEQWQAPDGSQVLSATIITTQPNDLVASIHNRMPVILAPSARAAWLEPGPQPPEVLNSLLKSYPSDEMEAYPVSTLVNSPANDRAEILARL